MTLHVCFSRDGGLNRTNTNQRCQTTDYGVTLIIWVAAESGFSIIGCCLPVMFYLARHYIVNRPFSFSLFSTKQTSSSKSFRTPKRPTTGNYGRQPSEHSIELAQRSFATAAAPVGYAVRATKGPANDDDAVMDYDSVAPAIVVQRDVDVRSHGDC